MGSGVQAMRALFLLLNCVFLFSCTSESAEKPDINTLEFDLLCDQFSSLVQSPDFEKLNPKQRAEQLQQKLATQVNVSGSAFLAWDAIRLGPPELRYSLFKESANSVGYPDWSCAAIEAHGHEVGTPH